MRPAKFARDVLDKYWGFNIPVNVEQIARNMGVVVRYARYLGSMEDDISGSFDIINGQPICMVRSTDALVRQRFTLAHELGHFVLNHGKAFRDNAANFNSYTTDYREYEANQFAAELLMPESAIDYFVRQSNFTVGELAKKFNVSGAAMEFRLNNLGYL
ncbi:ImmA/IrrE family metallo-endopeptidase [Neisseria sp. 74A18]|uniref:ImmA/IrrE family metallo-endopeptidase n=1 Tax=Neisseria sp. 74A18 TaxID=1696094 RepID=UPI0006CAE544|nr:ImmA/IrrE family metallo-endopeptidase [Neisseria sp. 74A18]KPN73913.1 hypothetical protein AKG43_05450 [Neisseria sp. 74A18]